MDCMAWIREDRLTGVAGSTPLPAVYLVDFCAGHWKAAGHRI